MPQFYEEIKQSAVGKSDWIKINTFDDLANGVIHLIIEGDMKVSVEMTIDKDVNLLSDSFEHELLHDLTEGNAYVLKYPISALRLNVKEYINGTATLKYRYLCE